jgi:small-conductance mechanosensitive channel
MIRLQKSLLALAKWAIANLIGIGFWLYLASALWPVKGEETAPGGPGDAFVIVFAIWPILLVFAVANFATLYLIIRRVHEKRTAFAVWIVIILLWIAAVLIDHGQSGHKIAIGYS